MFLSSLRGTQVQLAPLRMHGTRKLEGPLCTTLMHITSGIMLALMWLPLGAGFILGICSFVCACMFFVLRGGSPK